MRVFFIGETERQKEGQRQSDRERETERERNNLQLRFCGHLLWEVLLMSLVVGDGELGK